MLEQKLRPPIRSYSRRIGRITERQKTALDNLLPRFEIKHNREPLVIENVFQRQAPLNVEIGFGMGEAIVSMAENTPDENFLGIEVHTPGVGNLLSQIDTLKLKNIRIIVCDAVDVFKHQITDQSINSICIFFSDPWHKPKHHKRRLISEAFTKLLAQKLIAGGRVYLATDWEHYAHQMLQVFSANTAFTNLSPSNDYCQRIPFRPLTKFEKRGLRLGHDVWDLVFECKR